MILILIGKKNFLKILVLIGNKILRVVVKVTYTRIDINKLVITWRDFYIYFDKSLFMTFAFGIWVHNIH